MFCTGYLLLKRLPVNVDIDFIDFTSSSARFLASEYDFCLTWFSQSFSFIRYKASAAFASITELWDPS